METINIEEARPGDLFAGVYKITAVKIEEGEVTLSFEDRDDIVFTVGYKIRVERN